MTTLPEIRVAIADRDLRERSLAALRTAGLPTGDPGGPVIVLTDTPRQGEPEGDASGSQPGIVLIGVEGPADVVLPRDFTPRELKLAVSLLAEIVALRHRDAQGLAGESASADQALLDPLTGCFNRRAWDAELKRRCDTARASGESLCLALFDLDYLKQVNTAWGHPEGDRLLRAAATALSDSLRQNDFVARLGGDEFGVLISGLSEADAAAVLERVHAGLPGRLARSGVKVTGTSVGYAIAGAGATPLPSILLEEADRALRRAKAQGRNCIVGDSEREGWLNLSRHEPA